eukprot:CAMPEP_0201495982 /NCGR_PEP_ID=MMETSP0151_2-20130828/57233_1 /ASSEMBLY_ACC=CAM_ASM_000257 /TAXON_ID=200890 /ORGANISM="Paramoeba atlantica, Strain 621/1 / CCAP 1560/9" /LENGTH=47 /DNA_ID= /DNA_START= /DNA_END= /DNA_ORIENTATION=
MKELWECKKERGKEKKKKKNWKKRKRKKKKKKRCSFARLGTCLEGIW